MQVYKEKDDILVNFIIQSFGCGDTIYSGVKPFSTIYWFNLAVLGNYEIDLYDYLFTRRPNLSIFIQNMHKKA